MILTEANAPEGAPVRAFAEHLRLGTGFADDGSLDAVLELYLRAAMAAIEVRIGRALLARPFVLTVERWRDDGAQALPVAPARTIDGVTVVDAGGAAEETAAADWALRHDGARPRLTRRDGAALPRIPAGGRAEIRFTAGYGAWEDVPADLRQATFLLAAQYFERRSEAEPRPGAMPFGVLALLEAYRAARLGGGGA